MGILQIDLVSVLVIAAETVAILLPVIGVLTEKKRENTMNLIKHGFLSTAALSTNVVLIFAFMIPVFSKIVESSLITSLFHLPIMWIHAITGVVAVVLGAAMIVAWARQPLADLGCSKTWKLMLPTLIIWTIALALGVFIHLFGWR